MDVGTGTLGTPLDVDTGTSRGIYTALDIDNLTGQVMVAQSMPGDLCVIKQSQVTTANLDTGTVAPSATAGRCLTGVAADQIGQNAYLTFGPLFSYPNLLPAGTWETANETSLAIGPRQPLGANSAFFPVIDPVHHLALVAFIATSDYLVNSNAMSAVGVYDLTTGKRVALSADFNFVAAGIGGAGWFTTTSAASRSTPPPGPPGPTGRATSRYSSSGTDSSSSHV